MSKITIQGCGCTSAAEQKASIEIETHDFSITVHGKDYRIGFDKDGSLTVCLINGIDARIIQSCGYPAVKLIHM